MSSGVDDNDNDDDNNNNNNNNNNTSRGPFVNVSLIFVLICLIDCPSQSSSSDNIFDNLPTLTPTSSDIHNELDHYLATDTEDVHDGLLWWHEQCTTYPHLSRMARDYLLIPGKMFCHFYTLVAHSHSQLPQSMLSVLSVKVGFYSPTCAADSPFNQCVPFCVWASGVYLDLSETAM
jgi:hypothetical protein